MENEIAIKVDNVKKSFKLPHQKTDSLKGLFVNIFNRGRTFERQQVLRGISFDVKKGEFLGIVGRNGGGKSTLLKLLAQIYLPDSGSVSINGTLTPFIELGVGFNPDLTGRENVYLNGALLGFNRKAMNTMYDDIVKFAELEKFMDQKLKNYSSGMQVRLAFSVAIQAKTDILLIDEVLAVGDANFQKKCFDVFERFKREGRTVIFISHSMQQVTRFCDRVILLNKGLIKSSGEPEVVAAEYDMLNDDDQKDNAKRIEIKTSREAYIVDVVIKNFSTVDRLIELGEHDKRDSSLISSIGIETISIKNKTISSVTGMLILNSITEEQLKSALAILNDNRIKIYRVYIHMPFELFEDYIGESKIDVKKRVSLEEITRAFRSIGFYTIRSGLLGDNPGAQYIEAVFDRFDKNKQDAIWKSHVKGRK